MAQQRPFDGVSWYASGAAAPSGGAHQARPSSIRVDRGPRSWRGFETAWWCQLNVDAARLSDAIDKAFRIDERQIGNGFSEWKPASGRRLGRIVNALHHQAGAQAAQLLGWHRPLLPQISCGLTIGGGAGFHHDPDFTQELFVATFLRVGVGAFLELPRLGVRLRLQCGTCVVFDPLLVHGITRGEGVARPVGFVAAVTVLKLPPALCRPMKACGRGPDDPPNSADLDIDPATGAAQAKAKNSRPKRR